MYICSSCSYFTTMKETSHIQKERAEKLKRNGEGTLIELCLKSSLLLNVFSAEWCLGLQPVKCKGWVWNNLGIIWRFIYSHIWWLILATNWDLSWSNYPEHLHMTSSNDWLGFLIAWWLDTKSKHPKLYHILWLILRSHIASLSDPRSHRSSSQLVEQQTHRIRRACGIGNNVAAILKTTACHTYHAIFCPEGLGHFAIFLPTFSLG